jgi:hypothetical protein
MLGKTIGFFSAKDYINGQITIGSAEPTKLKLWDNKGEKKKKRVHEMLGTMRNSLKEMTVSFGVAPQPKSGVIIVDKKKKLKPIISKPDQKK